MAPVCAALAVAIGAAAAPPPLELEYSAPSGCPSKESVVAGVQRLRGPVRVSDASSPAVRAVARLKASGERWVARVTTQSAAGAGERSLDAETCDQLAQEVEVVLTLALADPSAPPPTTPAIDTAAAPPARAPLTLEVEAGGGVRLGVLPDVMPLARVSAGIEWSWLRAAVELGLSGSTRVAGPPAAATVDSWVQAGLSACAAPVHGEFRLDACVAFDTAVLSASGRVAEPASNTTVWIATELRLRASARLWRGLHGFAEVGGGVAVLRPRFFVDLGGATETVYQSPLLSGLASAGLTWNW